MALTLYPPSSLDASQVLQHAFDDDTQRLRTEGTATIVVPPGGLEVNVSQVDDSIRIGDGINLITSTAAGPKQGLDVNVINSIDLSISQVDDSIRIGDGVNLVTTTTSGGKVGLDVNVISASTGGTVINTYNEVTGVASASETTVISYTVPGGVSAYLQMVRVAGTNISEYRVKVNGSVIDKKYTNFGANPTVDFDYRSDIDGFPGYGLTSGDILIVTTLHGRPYVGNFNANLSIFEV